MESNFPHYEHADLDKHYSDLEQRLFDASRLRFQFRDPELSKIDFVMIGATQRTLTNLAAFVSLIKHQYLTPAASLCRLQLDTLMRLHAFDLVENPFHLAQWIFDGKHVKDYKITAKQKLHDKYLVQSLEGELEGVKNVYDRLSSFIHFSDRHFFTAAISTDDSTRAVHFRISRTEVARTVQVDELCHAFFEITVRIIGRMLRPPLELQK